jgi:hypothetical protein
VLNELVRVACRKLAMTWSDIGEVLTQVRAVCRVEPLTVETHARGVALAERYNLSIYDATILASALDAGCSVAYAEDMQDGQVIEGALTIRIPFSPERRSSCWKHHENEVNRQPDAITDMNPSRTGARTIPASHHRHRHPH